METTIKKLYAVFDATVLPHQLHDFRSEFRHLGEIVYNRDDQGQNLYGYPLIQFRSHQGHGAVFGLNEGAVMLHRWIHDVNAPLLGPEVYHDFTLKKVIQSDSCIYRLFHWVPLDERYFGVPHRDPDSAVELEAVLSRSDGRNNMLATHVSKIIPHSSMVAGRSETVQLWNDLDMVQKVKTLESILTNNILEFATSCQWRISRNKSLRVRLLDIHAVRKVKLYGRQYLSFDITYEANVLLPDHLGLGKGKSLGFGWQLASLHGRKDRVGSQKHRS